MPAKIVMQVLDPIDLGRYEPEAADDDQIVERIYQDVTSAMQDVLDELNDEIPHPILHRLRTAIGL